MNVDASPSATGSESDDPGSVRARLRDKWLWTFLILVAVAVVVRLVAHDYYLDNGAFDCFPGCTFKQDLSNWAGGLSIYIGVLFAIAASVRWILLGRRARAES